MIVLATRGSPLARWQANEVRRLLLAAKPARPVELLIVESSGDRDRHTDLARFGRTGIFTAEVDDAVLSGRAHAGVHSLKDMTTTLTSGLMLAGVLPRGPVEDALVGRTARTLAALPTGARVATGSVRRVAFVRRARPDVEIAPMRGNVGTRISKLAEGAADALVMARAGLERLGLGAHITEVLPCDVFVPAVGQGIVGLTCRSGDSESATALGAISDFETMAEAMAERALLARLHGGCNAPVGAHARAVEGAIRLHAVVLSLDGRAVIEDRISGPVDDAVPLGDELAQRLIEKGAKKWIEEARSR